MATYSLSKNFFEELSYSDISDILFCFSNAEISAKIVVDKDMLILDEYIKVCKFKEYVKMWLDLLTNNYKSCMEILDNYAICSFKDLDEVCLALIYVANVKGGVVVHSCSMFTKNIDDRGYVNYKGKNIRIFDKEEVKKELNSISISNSIVAMNGPVNNSNNYIK